MSFQQPRSVAEGQHLREEYREGYTIFCGRRILVDQRVLVPREKTQTTARVATAAIDRVAATTDGIITVVDIGTGSGAVVITAACECTSKDVRYLATDISLDALEVARQNAAQYSLLEKITFFQGDLLNCLPVQPDVVVANLPYLPQGAEVPSHVICEPAIALFDSGDGIQLVTRLLEQISKLEKHPGAVILEFSPEGIPKLISLVRAMFPTLSDLVVHRDHEKLERVVELRCL